MKKLLMLCALAYATVSSAVEIPAPNVLDRYLQEHVTALARVPKEQRKDVHTKWLALCEALTQELSEAIMKKQNPEVIQQLQLTFVTQFLLPLYEALMSRDDILDAEERAEMEQFLALFAEQAEQA